MSLERLVFPVKNQNEIFALDAIIFLTSIYFYLVFFSSS